MWELLGNILELVGTDPELEGNAWELRGKEDNQPASFFSAMRLNLFGPGVKKSLTMFGDGLPDFPELITLTIFLLTITN